MMKLLRVLFKRETEPVQAVKQPKERIRHDAVEAELSESPDYLLTIIVLQCGNVSSWPGRYHSYASREKTNPSFNRSLRPDA